MSVNQKTRINYGGSEIIGYELYNGHEITISSDRVLLGMPPIPVYKAETDREPVIIMYDIDIDELKKAMKAAIDKVVEEKDCE